MFNDTVFVFKKVILIDYLCSDAFRSASIEESDKPLVPELELSNAFVWQYIRLSCYIARE